MVLRAKLQDTQEEHVLQAAQHSVYLLASQHHAAVVSSLLSSPMPFDRYLESQGYRRRWLFLAGLPGSSLTHVAPFMGPIWVILLPAVRCGSHSGCRFNAYVWVHGPW